MVCQVISIALVRNNLHYVINKFQEKKKTFCLSGVTKVKIIHMIGLAQLLHWNPTIFIQACSKFTATQATGRGKNNPAFFFFYRIVNQQNMRDKKNLQWR